MHGWSILLLPYLADYERRRSGVRVRFSFFSLISCSSLTRTSTGMTPRAADIRFRLDRLGTLLPFSTLERKLRLKPDFRPSSCWVKPRSLLSTLTRVNPSIDGIL